jgi:glucosamine-6-phosphate deaminase
MPSDSCLTDDEILRLIALPLPELQRQARLAFRIVPDQPAILQHFADALLAEIRRAQQEPVRLILPVGPVSQYRTVVEASNREGLSWKNVQVFTMDEFLDWEARPIPTSHPLSFEGFMRRALFSALDPALRPSDAQLHFPHPGNVDRLSEEIRAGGIDACFGGIGYHGHVAFNDPPLSRWHRVSVDQLRRSRARVLTLGDDSVVVQSIHSAGGCSAAIPPMAVTLGLGDILVSRKIRLYCAAGERHRAIFRISVAGTPCIEYPSTLVQGHPDAEVITDAPTAAPIELGIR